MMAFLRDRIWSKIMKRPVWRDVDLGLTMMGEPYLTKMEDCVAEGLEHRVIEWPQSTKRQYCCPAGELARAKMAHPSRSKKDLG